MVYTFDFASTASQDHAHTSYMRHAFPHDELKPLSGTYTDSLGELGNAKLSNTAYSGVAMTLIDSLDTLAVVGNRSEFVRAVRWIGRHVTFDLDLRVNLFETNIRILGGLLAAHTLATDASLDLMTLTVVEQAKRPWSTRAAALGAMSDRQRAADYDADITDYIYDGRCVVVWLSMLLRL
jgi:hypothetical protein